MTVAAAVLALGDPHGASTAGGMDVRWWWQEQELVVLLDAPTRGWVAVGFGERETLAGSRLLLAAVRSDGAVAEEHRAEPPVHPFVRRLAVRAAEETSERTRVLVAFPRAAVAGGPQLAPGIRVGLTLAFSLEDDFAHHSVFRTLMPTAL